MNSIRTILFLGSFLTASAVFGQTDLVIARSNIYLDDTGQPTFGDSSTLAYNNHLLTSQIYNWKINPQGTWTQKSRIIDHTYDANDHLLYYRFQTGDEVNGWTNSYQYTYTYDAAGNELTYLEEQWNGANWITKESTIRVYDANGNQLSATSLGYRQLYSYNAQNLLETKTYQELSNGNWVDNSRQLYAYLPNVSMETIEYYVNGAWVTSERYSNTYDANDNIIEVLYETWNGTSWVNGYRTASNYDGNGLLQQALTENWDGNTWVNSSLLAYTYDANQNLIFWSISNWDAGAWKGSVRQFNGYDAKNNFIHARLESWNDTDWSLISYGRLYYAEFVATQAPVFAAFDVFPNPASTSVTLKGEGFDHAMIFDQQGGLVRTQRLQGQQEETLLLGNLPAGNYILQVVGKNGLSGARPIQIR